MKRKFIVLNQQLSGHDLLDDAVDARTEIFPGELFEEICVTEDRLDHEWLSLMSIDRKGIVLECDQWDVRELDNYRAHLLQPVTPYLVRLELVEKNHLEEAISFKHGSSVTVQIGDMPFPGLIRYSGTLQGKGDGIYFGVELPHHCGHGNTDGSVDGRYYFRCPPNSAVFVHIQQLHALDTTNEASSRLDFLNAVHKELGKGEGALAYGTAAIGGQMVQDVRQRLPAFNEYRPVAAAASELEQLPLRPDDAVFFFNEQGNRHLATVRWIGRISKTDHQLVAGLELEEPVGSGTGLLQGEQLFITRPNHAVFAPLGGLQKVQNAAYIAELAHQPLSYDQSVYPDISHHRRNPCYNDMATMKATPPTAPPSNGIGRTLSNRMAFRFPPKHTLIEKTVIKTKKPKEPFGPDFNARDHQRTSSGAISPAGQATRTLISNAQSNYAGDDFGSTGLLPKASVRTDDVIYPAVHGNRQALERSNSVDRNPLTSPMVYQRETAGLLGVRRMQAVVEPVVVGLRSVHPETEFGKKRGIQGHQNSCYLDATLFAMFAFSNVFDKIVFRKRRKGDIDCLEEVQDTLQELIVKPLRTTLYVWCDEVMKLRKLMDEHSDVGGLMDQEKDPEEFLSSLLEQILKIDPLLKLTSSDTNWYTLFIEKDYKRQIPTIQELFDASLITSDVRLKEAPKCLIMRTPRSGAKYKMYRQILPSPTIDITDAIVGQARFCCICQDTAQLECKDCYGWMMDVIVSNLSSMVFCRTCFTQRHKKPALSTHNPPIELTITGHDNTDNRVIMELFALVCIKTSHYVTFAKDGDGMWYYFDSMADRVGGEGNTGFNLPEIWPCPEVQEFLDPQEGRKRLLERLEAGFPLPEPVDRFFEDAYLCMYQPKAKYPNQQLKVPQILNTSFNLESDLHHRQIARQTRPKLHVFDPSEGMPIAAPTSVLGQIHFRMNESVFFFTPDGDRHFAVVRWIGHIDRTDDQLYAGLELDEPVGSGNGKLNGQQLFLTRPGRAVYAPLGQLQSIENAVFLGEQELQQQLYEGHRHPEAKDLEQSLGHDEIGATNQSSQTPAPSVNAAGVAEAYERLRKERTCTVCMDRERQMVFQPCGHVVCCADCAGQVQSCPVCTRAIAQKSRVYLS